jgi:dTDP-4-dehydrorhamnose reductase
VYGARGRNFLRTVLRLAESGKPLRIVDDQTGSPTWSRDIALATALIIGRLSRGADGDPPRLSSAAECSGIYHVSSGGYVTWHGFAAAILEESQRLGLNRGVTTQLVPITTPEYPTPARRPANSRLSNEKLFSSFGITLPHWRDSLRRVLEELAEGRGAVQ